MRLRRPAPPRLETGERVLAWCEAEADRRLAGTRDALHLLPDGPRIPWEEVQAADWDRDTEEFVVSEVGEWGQVRPEHRFRIAEPGRLLELVRERVTASLVLQRHAPVRGQRGIRVIARRAPRGDLPIRWIYEYDEGVDPQDPQVRDLGRALLAQAQEEIGA